jgi:hypothetical protein
MNTQTVTVVAAIIAAFASVYTMCVNLFAQYYAEMRVAYRKTLEPHLGPLGKSLYETMACSKMLAEKNEETGASRANWKARADTARDTLKAQRLDLRYSLWGLDEPIRVITRVPNWIEHNKGKAENTKTIILLATDLRKAIDESIRKAYTYGRPLPWWERRSLAKKAKALRESYRNGAPPGFYDEENGG